MRKFEAVINESDLITYSWQNCGGLLCAEVIDSDLIKTRKIQTFYKEKNMFDLGLIYDENYPITFYKKIADNYIAWYKYENKKWIKLL